MAQVLADHADVLVIGGGQAATEVVKGLRRRGFEGTLRMAGDEKALPYERPPLSKGVLAGDVELDRLALGGGTAYEDLRVDIDQGRRITALDAVGHIVEDSEGGRISYGRCVLATGARSVPAPWVSNARIHSIRTFDDAVKLRAAVREGGRDFLIVGGGFLGLETATSLIALGAQVTVVEAGQALLAGKASGFTSKWLLKQHQDRGLTVHIGWLVVELQEHADGVTVRLGDGTVLAVDHVVYAVGALPNIELAAAAGARVGRGVFIDGEGRTSLPDVYAAGDVASTLTSGGAEARIESVDNAVSQAKAVVRAIMGDPVSTTGVPTFWTEQAGVRIQQAGWIPPGLETHDVVSQDESGWFVERFVAGALVAVESLNRPVDYLKAVRNIVDLRFRV